MALFYTGGPAVIIFIVCIVFYLIFCHMRMKENASRQAALQLPVRPPQAVISRPVPLEIMPPIRSLEGILVVQPAGEQAVAWIDDAESSHHKSEDRRHEEVKDTNLPLGLLDNADVRV
jgi:hypothetical protein